MWSCGKVWNRYLKGTEFELTVVTKGIFSNANSRILYDTLESFKI